MERVSSGVDELDVALGGLLLGDNVVWFGGDTELHEILQRALFAATPAAGAKVFVTTRDAPAQVRRRTGADVDVIDARPGKPLAGRAALAREVRARGATGARVDIDHLDDLVRRMGSDGALAFFSRVCPQLFDLGTVCYWRADDGSRAIRAGVRSVTQCVLDLSGGRLRIDKSEGRHGAQGRIFRLHVEGGRITVDHERALGRLAGGLRSLRSNRRLSQSDVARVAGVSPSAISQAEAGRRGLGLDTVIAIADGFGVSIDHLLETAPDPGYVIARRDRAVPRRGVTPLLDDPAVGLRAHLVTLGPGEAGEPPTAHKGPELIVVAAGLVQIDLGSETPVMRAGDAVLVTTTAVHGWRNLSAGGSRFFWVLRDPIPRDA